MQGVVEPRDGLLVRQGDEGARVRLRRVGGAVVVVEFFFFRDEEEFFCFEID